MTKMNPNEGTAQPQKKRKLSEISAALAEDAGNALKTAESVSELASQTLRGLRARANAIDQARKEAQQRARQAEQEALTRAHSGAYVSDAVEQQQAAANRLPIHAFHLHPCSTARDQPEEAGRLFRHAVFIKR